jgi:hypothetical protein
MSTRTDLPVEFSTLVDLLRWRAMHQPDQPAYTFLSDGDAAAVRLSYAELDRQSFSTRQRQEPGRCCSTRRDWILSPRSSAVYTRA